jgi:hypothetical protein
MSEFVFDLNANMEIVGSEEHQAYLNPEIIDLISSDEEMIDTLPSPSPASVESEDRILYFQPANSDGIPMFLHFYSGIGGTAEITDQ